MAFDLQETARVGGPVGEVARLQYLKQLSDHTCHYYTHTVREYLYEEIDKVQKAIDQREKELKKEFKKNNKNKKFDLLEHLSDPLVSYLVGVKSGLEKALHMI